MWDARRASATFEEAGAEALERLCSALEFGPRTAEVVELFRDMVQPWGRRRIGERPAYPSDVGDDHSPFELSVSFGAGEPEVRLLVEAQGTTPTLRDNMLAARLLTELLSKQPGVSLDRFRAIEELFLPDHPEGDFTLWHAVSFWPSRPPAFKVYLNPRVRGEAASAALIDETLQRLGFDSAWPLLEAKLRSGGTDVLAFLSLDLDGGPKARVKVYYRHYDVTSGGLEHFFSAARNHRPGQVRDVCHALAGFDGPFDSKPVGSCFSFVAPDVGRPITATLYFPVAYYAPSDEVVRQRVDRMLAARGMAVAEYRAALAATAQRPLDVAPGLQSYVSFRQEPTAERATVYLSPELYRDAPQVRRPSWLVRRRERSDHDRLGI